MTFCSGVQRNTFKLLRLSLVYCASHHGSLPASAGVMFATLELSIIICAVIKVCIGNT